MDLFQKIIEDKIKRYGVFALTVTIVIATILTGICRNLLNLNFKTLKTFIDQFIPSTFHGLLLFVIFLVLLFYILKFWDEFLSPTIVVRIFVLLKSVCNKNKVLGIPPISKWVFQGDLQISQSLKITSSNSGALLKHSLYKNFSMTFRLNLNNGIDQRNALGIIFQAQDLDNFFMLQIRIDNQNKIAIAPHIRFLGDWDVFSETSTNLSFDKENGEKIYFQVENYIAQIKIKDYEFNWYLPTHVEVNFIQHHNNDSKQSTDNANTSKVWFRDRYGKIGFRAQGKFEKAEIDQLEVVEL